MNLRKSRIIIPLIIGMTTLTGCFNINIPGGGGNDKPLTNIEKYYKNVDVSDSNFRLFEDLHKLMWDTHENHIKYSDFWNFEKKNTAYNFDAIDRVPNTNYIQMFYSGASHSAQGTREHVWPCANSNGLWPHNGTGANNVDATGYWGGGSDLFHVRPLNSNVNELRGNAEFVDFDDPEYNGVTTRTVNYEDNKAGCSLKFSGGSLKNSLYTYASKVEVDDSMKGDVARILAYVWLHYSSCSTTPSEYKATKTASLSFTNVVGYSSNARCMQKLIEWNKLDKVSEVEKLRNNNVQRIQGNRNPFVDFPDTLMEDIFEPFLTNAD